MGRVRSGLGAGVGLGWIGYKMGHCFISGLLVHAIV